MAVKGWKLAVVAVFLAGAALTLVWQARIVRRESARAAQLAAENGSLRQRVQALTRQTAAGAPAAVPERPPEERSPGAVGRPSRNPEDVIAIEQLRLSVADANAKVAALQSRIDEAEARIQNLTVDNKRLSGSEADLTQNLAAANQAVDALQKELKSRSDHVTQIEIAYQKLRDQSAADTKKAARMQQLAAELQDIYQRREVYLNNVLRRYKQITEQYRSLSGVIDSQRTDAPRAGSTDLARIQDSISLAEEDLRQLNGLNAQALRLQKKLAGQ